MRTPPLPAAAQKGARPIHSTGRDAEPHHGTDDHGNLEKDRRGEWEIRGGHSEGDTAAHRRGHGQ